MRINTRVIRIDPERIDHKLVEYAARVLREGGLVAFPTETVYGLGALISKPDAVKRIFEVKGRPPDNPLIVHVTGIEMFLELVREPPEEVIRLAEKLWPGPFTIVWWKKPVVPDIVTAGLPKVAVRSPAHPVALKLIEYAETAIAAPSANRSGKPSPTRAEHVIDDLYGLIEVIIDSGETLHGVESTVIDFTHDPPRLLRPGALPIEEVEKLLGKKIEVPDFARGISEAERAEAPGMKYRHYAPEARLVVVETSDYNTGLANLVNRIREVVARAKNRYRRIAILCSSETCSEYQDLGVTLIEIGSRKNLFTIAKKLFAALRELDKLGIEYAIAEGVEEKGLGLAIMNRLRKASGRNIIRV
ncbi:MAG: L-threonylcarbamoyladenylate synthase [Thermoprotei archaeon]